MAGKFSVTYKDYNAESSAASFPIPTITNSNITTITPQLGSLETALAGVTVGRNAKETTLLSVVDNGDSPSSDPLAQREIKWLVYMVDTVTGDTLRREIPTADLSLLSNNSDLLDLTSGAGASLKAAIEAVAENPDTGNSVTVTQVRFVGRNT